MLPWHKIDTVLLDMDGTLLDLHFDNYFWTEHLPQRYAHIHGVPLAEAEAVIMAQVRAHQGTLKWYCLEHWSQALRLDVAELKQEVKHKIQMRPHVREWLQRLQALGKRACLITNAHPDSLSIKLEVTQIDQWLDVVISSHQFGHPKEDQEFWQQLALTEPFDPSRTLFIDDTEHILASAQRFGIAHLLCIQHPDSQQAPRRDGAFAGIHHFDEILPSL